MIFEKAKKMDMEARFHEASIKIRLKASIKLPLEKSVLRDRYRPID
jgi:hypothetical protein